VDNSCHVNELMKRRERPLSIVTRNWDHAENSMSRAQFILRKTKSLVGLQSSSFKRFISWLRVKMKSNRPITSLNSRIMRQTSVHEPRSSCDRNQFEENSEPRVRYRGVFKSRADIKFGEFILPLRNIEYKHYTGDRAPFQKSVKAQKSKSNMLMQWQIVLSVFRWRAAAIWNEFQMQEKLLWSAISLDDFKYDLKIGLRCN
jgi:hypothetical protein